MSILTDAEIDKWVKAVTDLMDLTGQGKLIWKPTTAPKLGVISIIDSYEAEFNGRKLRLDVDNSRLAPAASGIANLLYRNPTADIRLTLLKDDVETLVFPPIVALRGLVAVVRDHLYGDPDDFFSQLRQAAQK